MGAGVFACLLLSIPLLAQNYGYVAGSISDASDSSVPGAVISVVNEDTGFRRETQSQPDGRFSVWSLEPGLYKITVRKPGFRTMIQFGVKVSQSQPARADFKLVIGSVQETITVEGTAPLLDDQDASVGTLVSGEFASRLPVNGHSLLEVLQFTAGVIPTPATRGDAGQFTVDGQRPNTHYFMVDGVSANSGVSGGGLPAQSNGGTLPAMTAFGTLDSVASLESVQEVRVQTSTTVPEFGRLPGAQISLTSRSGSNDFHGGLTYGFRNEALDANDWFANRHGDPRAPLSLYDLAPTFTGPILKNLTFFALAYQLTRLTQPLVADQPVPSLADRLGAPPSSQQALALFPLPNNGPATWTSRISRPSQLDGGSARIDQAITPRITLFARYSESASSTAFGTTTVNWLDLRSRSATFGVNLRARSNLLFDLRLNDSRTTSFSVWQPGAPCFSLLNVSSCGPLIRFTIDGIGQIISGPEGKRSQGQFQVSPTASLHVSAHSIRFGGDYRRLSPSRDDAAPTLTVSASGIADLQNPGSLWNNTAPAQHVSAELSEASLFAQDTWQAASRLVLTYGLRWEISPAPSPAKFANYLDPATGAITTVAGPIWKASYTNIAPRFGLAWRLDKTGKTVLRAGAGLYYDSSLSLATDLVNDGPLNVSTYSNARGGLAATILQYGFLTDLQLPRVLQWNTSLDRALGSHDSVSVSYVGSSGDGLIRRELGGLGSADRQLFVLATNHGVSSYESLQVQYRRRLAQGLEAIGSYAWSHSIDNSSTDSGLYLTGPGVTSAQDRASSDFDVRHVFTAGFSYSYKNWALDGIFRARSGFPINILQAEQFEGISLENVFRPNLLGGQPLWIQNGNAPGGRAINAAAFQPTASGVQGTLGRNAISGFGMNQLDLAARREFPLSEHRSLELRVEGFNIFNHPNFADPLRFLSSPLFGQSTSMLNLMLGTGSPGSGLTPMFQAGSSRSLQMTLKLRF